MTRCGFPLQESAKSRKAFGVVRPHNTSNTGQHRALITDEQQLFKSGVADREKTSAGQESDDDVQQRIIGENVRRSQWMSDDIPTVPVVMPIELGRVHTIARFFC
jgi:hypothetical protein